MTREISHQPSFEKALYAMQPNFPPGKLRGMKELSNVDFNMSDGGSDAPDRGPWNSEPTFGGRPLQPAVDGGPGRGEVNSKGNEADAVEQLAQRIRSDLSIRPATGAELGSPGGPTSKAS